MPAQPRRRKWRLTRTRAPKDHSIERSVLVASWRLRAEELGLGQDALRSLSPGGRQPEVPPARELADRLLGSEGLTLNASMFNRRDVLRALAEAMPEGATAAALEAMAGYVLADQRAVALAADRHDDRWSTTELLQTERALLSSAVRARTAGRAVADTTVISRAWPSGPA